MFRARDLNEAFVGRFFDVYIFESFAIQYVIVTSTSIGSLTRSTWLSLFIRAIILASQILGIIGPSYSYHGKPLGKYVV